MSADLLVMQGIAKRFGTTAALSGVDLHVGSGEVHALVGENGAGKSTLMKILSGVERPDEGTIHFRGEIFSPKQPLDSLAAGVAMIYQEFNLAPHLSVEANLLLGREERRGGFVLTRRWARSKPNPHERCRQVLARLGMDVSLDEQVGRLGVAQQQMVEIGRALLCGAKLIIMDEPTSALAASEVQRLFQIIRDLKDDGISIIYISHFLEELPQIASQMTVLRDGRTVAAGPVADWPRQRIVEAMVGRKVEQMYPRVPHEIGEALLEVQDLRGKHSPRAASFTLHRGEVLGIAGLVGSGRTETLRTLFGLDVRRGGWARLGQTRIERFSASDWTARRVGLLSEDRKVEGLALQLSCLTNITLSSIPRKRQTGWIDVAAEREAADKVAKTLRIKWRDPADKVQSLSGGNQQKVAMGRLLHSDAEVLLLDEPTRGIDVGAKVDLYLAIGELARRGKAIVLVSSYLPELFGVCDRIAVMCRGKLGAARDTSELTPEQVMHLAVGDAEPEQVEGTRA